MSRRSGEVRKRRNAVAREFTQRMRVQDLLVEVLRTLAIFRRRMLNVCLNLSEFSDSSEDLGADIEIWGDTKIYLKL